MKRNLCFIFATLLFCFLLPACSNQTAAVPTIKSIELLDKNGVHLPGSIGSAGEWFSLQADSIIKVDYEGEATCVEFYTVPTGTEVLLEQRIIGVVYVKKHDSTAQFEWKVPNSFMGYIWAVVYNNDIARTSNTNEFFIKAIYER